MAAKKRTGFDASAVGFFNFAHSYCISAHALNDAELRCTHRAAPIKYLCYHSMELYLKSFLIALGYKSAELSKRSLGHNLGNLANECTGGGLQLHDEYNAILQRIQDWESIIDARYLKVGVKQQVKEIALLATCHHLHYKVQEYAYSEHLGVRRPDLPKISLNDLEALELPNMQ